MILDSWLLDDVVIRKYKGQAGNGNKIYEDSHEKARVEKRVKIYNNAAGSVTAGVGVGSLGSIGMIFMKTKITPEDKLVLDGTEYNILRVDEFKTKNGFLSHYEGWFA